MAYKKLIKVSNVCQLLDKSKYNPSQTRSGITWTNNGDGSWTANGIAEKDFAYVNINQNIPFSNLNGHIIYICIDSTNLLSGVALELKIQDNKGNTLYYRYNIQNEIINLSNISSSVSISISAMAINKDIILENYTFKPQLFDLTEMYGAGNEPTTVEQFRQDFPEEMYDYKPYCFVKSYKNYLKVSDVCQLMVYPYYETTITRHGITFTDNGDGTITANGTSVGFATFVFSENFNFIAGNKYYVSTPYSIIAYKYSGTINYISGNKLFTWGSNWEIVQVYMQINTGITVSNLTFKPQLFDLTEMYGAGNEPTTVEQFRQDFPEEMYDYSPYSIIPSYKKSLVCKTKNLLPYPYLETTITRHGITFTDNGDGTITANGTSVGFATFVFSENFNFIAGNTYYFSTPYSIIAYKENGTIKYIQGNKSFTWSSNWEVVQVYVQINKGITLNNLKIYPMINLGSTATDYVPYGHL